MRVDTGGEPSATRSSRNAYACMLGGEDRRTLYVATAPDHEPSDRRARAEGRIEAIRSTSRASAPRGSGDRWRRLHFDFTDTTVIVTGAARGIGLEFSRYFSAAGADVWMVDVDRDLTEESAAAIGAVAAPADVTSGEDVARIVTDAAERTGRVDVVVNNAGLLRDKMLWKLSDEDWRAVVDVSLGGTFQLTRACVPHFRAQKRGRVINISSYTGLHGNIGQAAYAAAKAGVIGFTKTAAKELAHFGVTVNAIVPNARTRMVEAIPESEREAARAADPLETLRRALRDGCGCRVPRIRRGRLHHRHRASGRRRPVDVAASSGLRARLGATRGGSSGFFG